MSLQRLPLALLLLTLAGCDLTYTEVVVVNKTAEQIQLRNLSFNGCAWATVLAFGEATSPGRCLPGEDRVHFEKFDAAAYCREQADDGTIGGVCPCDSDEPHGSTDEGTVNAVPTWFNYQTLTAHHVDHGEFRLFEVTLDDMEQDFSVPGPYGH
jgi:hypothetical protein